MKASSFKHSEMDPELVVHTGLHAFFEIVAQWSLDDEQSRLLLGAPDPAVFEDWKRKGQIVLDEPPPAGFENWKQYARTALDFEMLPRISYLIWIHRTLRRLLPDSEAVDSWMRRPNADVPFGSVLIRG